MEVNNCQMQKAPADTPKKPNPPKVVLEGQTTAPVGFVKKILHTSSAHTLSPQTASAKTKSPQVLSQKPRG